MAIVCSFVRSFVVSVAQALWVSWVSGHSQKFKLGFQHPQNVKGKYQTY